MAAHVSPVNDNARDTDGINLSTSATQVLKRAVAGSSRSVTGGDTNAAAQEVGTHADDAAFTVGTDSIVVAGGLADETSPDSVNEGDAGAFRMGLDRVQLIRETGPNTTLAAHAINVTSGTVSIGTAITSGRKHIEIYNAGTATVYLGPSTVGTASGFPLGTAAYAWFDSGHDWYAVGPSAGTTTLRVLEMS